MICYLIFVNKSMNSLNRSMLRFIISPVLYCMCSNDGGLDGEDRDSMKNLEEIGSEFDNKIRVVREAKAAMALEDAKKQKKKAPEVHTSFPTPTPLPLLPFLSSKA
jgi:hypothetical protein